MLWLWKKKKIKECGSGKKIQNQVGCGTFFFSFLKALISCLYADRNEEKTATETCNGNNIYM